MEKSAEEPVNEPLEPVSPLYVPAAMSQTLMRDFMRPTDDDPSAFVTIQIFPHGAKWKMAYDAQCDLSYEERTFMFDDFARTWWGSQPDAVKYLDMALENNGWKGSGNWRVRPVAVGQLPEGDLAVPLATTAASDRKDQAMERIARVNPHLARMATEVQELMLWDQYANGALSALIQVYALDLDEGMVVAKACKYADAMMEARLARGKKKPAQADIKAEESPT